MAYLGQSIDASNATARPRLTVSRFFSHVPKKELVVFSRQLATMSGSNVPIVKSLRILTRQTAQPAFKSIISRVADDVDSGAKLSVAMSKFPKVFDHFFVYIVRAGESTGRLDEVLNYLADQKEHDYELNGKIVSALIYPALILTGLIGVFVVMMVKVIPNMLSLVKDTGATLPWTTNLLIGTSNAFVYGWPYMVVVLIIGVIGFFVLRATPAGLLLIDRARLLIPIFGPLYQKIYLSRFSRSLSNLLQSGVPINKALMIVSDIVGNHVYRKIIIEAEQNVEAGKTISGTLAGSRFIPVMLVQMVGVGEETGRIDAMLSKAAEFYSKEVERTTTNLVVLIEPLVIIALGLGTAILVAGILLPIYDISSHF